MGRIAELAYLTPANTFEVVNEYFRWLCDQVDIPTRNGGYWILAKDLHKKHFYWTVPNDDNRASDGKKLREEFLDERDETEATCLNGPCTMLELLVALSRRCQNGEIDEVTECHMAKWFWEMLSNIGLDRFTDDVYIDICGTFMVDQIIDMVLDRTYKRDGQGGLFPLKHPKKDQRKVEIWFQMSAYIIENYYFDDKKV